MDLRTVVRDAVLAIEKGGPDDAILHIKKVQAALTERGLEAGYHIGDAGEDGSERCIEWYAGQLLDIVDHEAWFAMNSFINCLDKFCPEK